MDYQTAVTYLDNHIGLGVRPGLERIQLVLDAMGNPERGYPTIHVAGTNGKTSTTRLASWLLVAHDLTTGTFTSPHLQDVRERLSINGLASTEDQFAQAVSDVAGFLDTLVGRGQESLTYFELTAAAAFAFFADQAVNAAVVEVGLGGRLDATNVLTADVNVITTIGLDHTEYLGNDESTIATEKFGIVDPQSIMITGDLGDSAMEVARATARDLGIQHRHLGRDFGVTSATLGVGGWLTTIEGAEDAYEDLFLPLHGRHQLANLAVAVAAVEALVGRKLNPDAVRAGTAAATVPGRMETVGSAPRVLLDGAHNYQGMQALAAALDEEFPTISWAVVLGALSEKDIKGMAEQLERFASVIVTTNVDTPRALDAGALAAKLSDVVTTPIMVEPDLDSALDAASGEAGSDGAVLVTGSLYLVGEARARLQQG